MYNPNKKLTRVKGFGELSFQRLFRTAYGKPTFISPERDFCKVCKSFVIANISHCETVIVIWLL